VVVVGAGPPGASLSATTAQALRLFDWMAAHPEMVAVTLPTLSAVAAAVGSASDRSVDRVYAKALALGAVPEPGGAAEIDLHGLVPELALACVRRAVRGLLLEYARGVKPHQLLGGKGLKIVTGIGREAFKAKVAGGSKKKKRVRTKRPAKKADEQQPGSGLQDRVARELEGIGLECAATSGVLTVAPGELARWVGRRGVDEVMEYLQGGGGSGVGGGDVAVGEVGEV